VVERVSAMNPDEFGARYSELLTGPENAESLLERSVMLADITAERAAAAYRAYKRRIGASDQENSNEIRAMLTAAGERDGMAALKSMLREAPGFCEISSLVHGCALKDPVAAVDWFNGLQPDAPEQANALTGLMWGLGQKDADMACAVFRKLSPEDQMAAAAGVSRSILAGEGLGALDRLVAGLSRPLVEKCLTSAVSRARSLPPQEFVPWLTTHLSECPTLNEPLLTAWQRWLTTDPVAANAWRTSAAVIGNPDLADLLPLPD
jgi:hypothetical protein